MTDDEDLIELGKMYGVYTMTSLELMRLMLDERHITIDLVHRVVAQWEYDHDLPANFATEYEAKFGEKPLRE